MRTQYLFLFAVTVLALALPSCAETTPGKSRFAARYLDGRENDISSFAVVDRQRGIQWDAVQYGHAIFIVPGTERPYPEIEKKP